MRRAAHSLALVLWLCCPATLPRAQTAGEVQAEVIRGLLAMPAPTPRAVADSEGQKEVVVAAAKIHNDGRPPADDAPNEEILGFWGRMAGRVGSGGPTPSEAVREHLLSAAEEDPELLAGLLKYMPEGEDAAARVKRLYDAATNDERLDKGWREGVRRWLLFNSRYFLGELSALANKARDKEGYVEQEEALTALSRVAWESAEPLLNSLAGGGQPRSATLALALLYKHASAGKDSAAADRYRERLRAVASDRNAPARARDAAIEALSLSEWAGRDEWYLSLFADETLLSPSDGSYGFSPLTTLFDRDPDRWIPLMAKLVESKDAAVRQNAASCLVQFVNGGGPDSKRRDAVLPVLRWLSDPAWLRISGTYRAWFMQHMDELEMPEAVPGLIWIVENEEEHSQWAARTLAHYKDRRAVPALRKALERERDEDQRAYFIPSLLASGGLSEAEQLQAVEAYASKLLTPGGRDDLAGYRGPRADPLPVQLSVGRYLAGMKEPPDSLARAVLARGDALRQKHPALSRSLLEIAHGWKSRQVYLDLLERVAAGKADAGAVASLLSRRDEVREGARADLQAMAASGGAAQGVAVVMLADDALARGVLASADRAAQAALLAAARLTQTPLPVAQAGPLLRSEDAIVALAAERYLLAEDSPEARQLLLERYPNEAFITGWRENVAFIGGNNFDAMAKAEESMRAEVLGKGGPAEVYALLSNKQRPSHVLRVYENRAVYTHYEDESRYRERAVKGGELAAFRGLVAGGKLLDSGPIFGPCHHDCSATEFLSLSRRGGHRVFAHQGAFAWMSLLEGFDALGRGDGAKVRYRVEEAIKGFEVLLADDDLAVRDVWQGGTELRVLVERPESPEDAPAVEEAEAAVDDEDDEGKKLKGAELRRRERERAKSLRSWRAFGERGLGAETRRPDGYLDLDPDAFGVDDEDFPAHLNGQLPRASAGDSVVLAADLGRSGLWKKSAKEAAVRLTGEGVYADPLVTPDGAWAVAAKTENHWGEPNEVVRVNLRTGKESRVALPPAGSFGPVAYLPQRGKVLLRRAEDDAARPAPAEFYLLDAATGKTERVSGDFEPLLQEGARPLQPTGKPFEVWAAVPDRAGNVTRVGRYNLRDFSLTPVLVVPRLTFDSFSMWVDEGNAEIYIVSDGHLLKLPLKPEAK